MLIFYNYASHSTELALRGNKKVKIFSVKRLSVTKDIIIRQGWSKNKKCPFWPHKKIAIILGGS